jgi:hypothetical protein
VNGTAANTESKTTTNNSLRRTASIKALSSKTVWNSHEDCDRKAPGTENGGYLDTLKPADLNKSGASENQREQEPKTTSNTRRDVWTQIEGWVQNISHQPFWVKEQTDPYESLRPQGTDLKTLNLRTNKNIQTNNKAKAKKGDQSSAGEAQTTATTEPENNQSSSDETQIAAVEEQCNRSKMMWRISTRPPSHHHNLCLHLGLKDLD